MKAKKVIFISLACVFFIVACVSAYNIWLIYSEYAKSDAVYEDVQKYVTHKETTVKAGDINTDAPIESIAVSEKDSLPGIDFVSLEGINQDVNSWLYIPDTKIDYPVVQTNNNDYYLNHLFDHSIGSAGSIFMDMDNLNDYSNPHTIIYGHHMKNGSMFAELSSFKKEGFYENHKLGYIIGEDASYRIEFFAGYVSDLYTEAWRLKFDTDEELLKWAAVQREKSDFVSDVKLEEGDKIITLSTCSYEFADARYVLTGKLIKLD